MLINKKSILLIEHSKNIGGGQVIFLELIDILLTLDYNVGVALPTGGKLEVEIKKKFLNKVYIISISNVELGNNSNSFFKHIYVLFEWLRDVFQWRKFKKYSLWYVNGGRKLLGMSIVSLLFNKKIIFHSHIIHSELQKSFLFSLIKIKILKKVITPSNFVHQNILSKSSLLKYSNSFFYLENALSKKFSNVPFVDRFPNDGGSINSVLVLGKVSPSKGQDLVCAIAFLFPSIKFYIVGHSDDIFYSNNLKLKSPSNVTFISETSDVNHLINSLKIQISIVPSRWEEPFGLVAIESMACSCITISSKMGGLVGIASNTGMLNFDFESNTNSLELVLNKLCKAESKMLSKIAFIQYSNTLRYYANEKYRKKFIKFISTI